MSKEIIVKVNYFYCNIYNLEDISTASTKSRNLYDYITSRAYSIKFRPYNLSYWDK